jgi:hypothetical protein
LVPNILPSTSVTLLSAYSDVINICVYTIFSVTENF